MKRRILFLLIICLLILTACGNTDGTPSNGEEMDIKQLVQDYSTDKITEGSASITSEELIITHTNGEVTVYPLPEDEFFVSIAPFIEQTHLCAIHSLTGCQGELPEKEFYIYIEDDKGTVIVDEKIRSFNNGFIDLWLKKNNTYQVKIEYEGKIAESKISTFSGDNTCITTMQLM